MVAAARPVGATAHGSEASEALVRRAQAGDRGAFAAIVEAHTADVARVARRIVGNADDASDVAQDAWLRVAANLEGLREPDHFQGWLRRIVHHAAADFVGRRGACASTSGGGDDLMDGLADTDGDTPEASLLSREAQRGVWEALGRLSETDRSILYLREHHDLPYEEIARRLGIARNTAEVRVFRARERFRRHYGEHEADTTGCGVSSLELGALADGELGCAARERVQRHVAACEGCHARLEAMRCGRRMYRSAA